MGDAGRVLVVETNGVDRRDLARTLTEAGYTAARVNLPQVLAAGGSAGLPDLVVTPWSLGSDIDGLRLHRTFAERTPGIASLILFRPEDVDRLPDAPLPPGVRLLSDPYDAGQLLSSARSAVAEARALRRS
jgi:DNA-binding NtrC family response regulator